MSSDIAIKVENISKCYEMYDKPSDRLKQMVAPRFRSAVGAQQSNYFREFWALKNVSFEVKKGETMAIIGRNGSGKSTLLQIICGTLNPTGGKLQTHGRIAALLELGSGFNAEFTGRENVYLNGAVLGLSRPQIDTLFDDIAGFADIGEFIERPVKTYSSGMFVRLAFAVQAMIDPDILIVDEALSVGDERFQRKCFARLDELKEKGSSILLVSHSLTTVIELCQKTLFLERGKRLMLGSAPDAIRAYQKLIYAPIEKQAGLILEMLANDLESGGQVTEYSTDNTAKILGGIENRPLASHADVDDICDTLDPSLVPATTIIYPTQGAVINSIHIANEDGLSVNVLMPGRSYNIILSGNFLQNFSAIYFGVHIKSVSGVVLSGQRYPGEGAYIEGISSKKNFEARFSFEVSLLPGVYFVGGGVWSRDEPNCAHRILDGLMFRVPQLRNNNSFGYVDVMSAEPVVRLWGGE